VAAEVGEADVVLSDMSPNISGNYAMDHARSIHLCEQAFAFAERALRPGGTFVVKVFEGDLFPEFLKGLRDRFDVVKPHHPPASRKESSEVYVIAKGFRGSEGKR
ncbi:MAG: SAM-dependent methyltransferase, partial [Methanobacteriota archaeon]